MILWCHNRVDLAIPNQRWANCAGLLREYHYGKAPGTGRFTRPLGRNTGPGSAIRPVCLRAPCAVLEWGVYHGLASAGVANSPGPRGDPSEPTTAASGANLRQMRAVKIPIFSTQLGASLLFGILVTFCTYDEDFVASILLGRVFELHQHVYALAL